MSPTTLRLASAEKELATVRGQLAARDKQLAVAVASAERARRVRVAPIRPGRVSHRTKGDVVRVLIPDTHGAKADRKAIAALLADLKTLDPTEIILLGDHVDCGGFLAQHHVMGYVAETTYSYEEDIAHANAFLDQLAAAAPRAKIQYIEGNHERRVETWAVTETLRHSADSEMLRRLVAPEFLLKLKERSNWPAKKRTRTRTGNMGRTFADQTRAENNYEHHQKGQARSLSVSRWFGVFSHAIARRERPMGLSQLSRSDERSALAYPLGLRRLAPSQIAHQCPQANRRMVCGRKRRIVKPKPTDSARA